MAEIVLFHSVLGIRRGIQDAANVLKKAGHTVHVPNLYAENVYFDDYNVANAYVEKIGGYPELIKRTNLAVKDLPNKLVYAGFSNGGASAEYLGATRAGALAIVMFSSATPLEMLTQIGGHSSLRWPNNVPVQVHYSKDDQFRNQGWIDQFATVVRSSSADYEFCEYSGSGHLFTDKDMAAEYNEPATIQLWENTTRFLAQLA